MRGLPLPRPFPGVDLVVAQPRPGSDWSSISCSRGWETQSAVVAVAHLFLIIKSMQCGYVNVYVYRGGTQTLLCVFSILAKFVFFNFFLHVSFFLSFCFMSVLPPFPLGDVWVFAGIFPNNEKMQRTNGLQMRWFMH